MNVDGFTMNVSGQGALALIRGMLFGVVLLTGNSGIASEPKGTPVVVGLDHIPVAVRDLDLVAERFRALGFVLKPGRPHANGIRNQHVKFPDGTELELITASEARDALTSDYRRHLEAGEGPAFLGLFAPDPEEVVRRLKDAGRPARQDSGLVEFQEPDALHPYFFGQRGRSPTDKPEHFAHPNTAEALIGVWLAAEDFQAERSMLGALGVTVGPEKVCAPKPEGATVAKLQEGDIVFLPASRQVVPGHRIMGATVRVRSLMAVRRALERSGVKVPAPVTCPGGESLFLSPDVTHGLWLEFRQPR